jgi:hypothetical protein
VTKIGSKSNRVMEMWCICNIRVWIPAMGTNNGHDNVSLYVPCGSHFDFFELMLPPSTLARLCRSSQPGAVGSPDFRRLQRVGRRSGAGMRMALFDRVSGAAIRRQLCVVWLARGAAPSATSHLAACKFSDFDENPRGRAADAPSGVEPSRGRKCISRQLMQRRIAFQWSQRQPNQKQTTTNKL